MNTTVNFRKRVMKYAWKLYRTTSQSWKTCMVKAWKIVKLIIAMTKGTVEFQYYKVAGSLRHAHGTLSNLNYISKGKGSDNWGTVRYFDVEKNAFRSFKIENLY